MASPQKENGYTPIANEILEKLIASNLNGTELAVVLFVLRKTYGYHKKEDDISLRQFLNAIPISKQTLCTALNNLKVVKILRLVKKGNTSGASNRYTFNKNYDEWQVVKKSRLVKKFSKPSQENLTNLVKKSRHTKERKKIQKKLSNSDFDLFWKEYPNKKAKAAALKSWQKISPNAALLELILAAVHRQKTCEQWTKDGGQFIPHPATWLNQQRWEDVIEPEKPPEKSNKLPEYDPSQYDFSKVKIYKK